MVIDQDDDDDAIKFYDGEEEVGHVEIEESYADFIMKDWLDADLFPEECKAWEKDAGYPVYIVNSVFTEEDFRGEGIAREMLKQALHDDRDYILNASPQYGTSLDSIVRLYKDVGFKELYDQGNNVVMYRHKK